MGNIFSQNSGIHGGYGPMLALVKLNGQHNNSEGILRENICVSKAKVPGSSSVIRQVT